MSIPASAPKNSSRSSSSGKSLPSSYSPSPTETPVSWVGALVGLKLLGLSENGFETLLHHLSQTGWSGINYRASLKPIDFAGWSLKVSIDVGVTDTSKFLEVAATGGFSSLDYLVQGLMDGSSRFNSGAVSLSNVHETLKRLLTGYRRSIRGGRTKRGRNIGRTLRSARNPIPSSSSSPRSSGGSRVNSRASGSRKARPSKKRTRRS